MNCERMEDIQSIPLLAGVPSGALREMIKAPRPLKIERGTILFHQGQPALDVHVLLHGWIKLFRTDESGAETIIHIAGPGEILGHDDLVLHASHRFSAEAVSPVRTLILDGRQLECLIERDPMMAGRVATALADQIQVMSRHVEELKRLDSMQRTANFLLRLCRVRGGPCSFSLPFEKAAIAGWLGMKPASFSRALACLRRFGVTVDRDNVSVVDPRRLSALVQTGPRTAWR